MKSSKVLDFIGTLSKLRRNFAQAMHDEHTKPEEKMYWMGKLDAHNEVIREVAQLESDIVELETSAPPDDFERKDLHSLETTH